MSVQDYSWKISDPCLIAKVKGLIDCFPSACDEKPSGDCCQNREIGLYLPTTWASKTKTCLPFVIAKVINYREEGSVVIKSDTNCETVFRCDPCGNPISYPCQTETVPECFFLDLMIDRSQFKDDPNSNPSAAYFLNEDPCSVFDIYLARMFTSLTKRFGLKCGDPCSIITQADIGEGLTCDSANQVSIDLPIGLDCTNPNSIITQADIGENINCNDDGDGTYSISVDDVPVVPEPLITSVQAPGGDCSGGLGDGFAVKGLEVVGGELRITSAPVTHTKNAAINILYNEGQLLGEGVSDISSVGEQVLTPLTTTGDAATVCLSNTSCYPMTVSFSSTTYWSVRADDGVYVPKVEVTDTRTDLTTGTQISTSTQNQELPEFSGLGGDFGVPQTLSFEYVIPSQQSICLSFVYKLETRVAALTPATWVGVNGVYILDGESDQSGF